MLGAEEKVADKTHTAHAPGTSINTCQEGSLTLMRMKKTSHRLRQKERGAGGIVTLQRRDGSS